MRLCSTSNGYDVRRGGRSSYRFRLRVRNVRAGLVAKKLGIVGRVGATCIDSRLGALRAKSVRTRTCCKMCIFKLV